MMNFIRDLLSPDDFHGDPYAWVTNQVSHAALGAWLTWTFDAWLPVLLACAAYEFGQWVAHPHKWRDGIADIFFMGGGVALVAAGDWWISWALLCALALGIVRRVE